MIQMVQHQLKLRLTASQSNELTDWLLRLTSVWNWAIKKIENDAQDGIYYSKYDFMALVNGHGAKIGIPTEVISSVVRSAWESWARCYKGLASKPKLKGARNKLASILLRRGPAIDGRRAKIMGGMSLKFHKQDVPEGKIKCARIIKRASGWYLCLFIEAEPSAIPATADGTVGIDPGFKDLLTLSTGEKIAHPRELEATEKRIGQAQRGGNRQWAARARERVANIRRDRTHKLSRRLVAENELIAFSADRHQAVARRFGKSVASSGHGQLRRMLAYKCTTSGRTYVEVNPNGSTKTCSACGSRCGPTGLAGLRVREWRCSDCGSHHDRDVNAALNTLALGLGSSHERAAMPIRNLASGCTPKSEDQTQPEQNVQTKTRGHG